MAAMLAAGADGVRIGTRFVASEEAGLHPIYTEALIAARAGVSVFYKRKSPAVTALTPWRVSSKSARKSPLVSPSMRRSAPT